MTQNFPTVFFKAFFTSRLAHMALYTYVNSCYVITSGLKSTRPVLQGLNIIVARRWSWTLFFYLLEDLEGLFPQEGPIFKNKGGISNVKVKWSAVTLASAGSRIINGLKLAKWAPSLTGPQKPLVDYMSVSFSNPNDCELVCALLNYRQVIHHHQYCFQSFRGALCER